MELSPQNVSNTTFKIVKKGYDPEQVKAYLVALGSSIEATQNQAAAMESRARAAVARLQELSAQPPSASASDEPASTPSTDAISRTLLLAQRTADAAVDDANAQAAVIAANAEAAAQKVIDGANEVVARMQNEAKAEARRAGDTERLKVEGEVQSLLARREFLLGDVEHLEQYIVTQRERVRQVAGVLSDIVTKVPGGLADLSRPLISAVSDDQPAVSDSSRSDEPQGPSDSGQLGLKLASTTEIDPIWVSHSADAAAASSSYLDSDSITEELPAVKQAPSRDIRITGNEVD